MTPRPFTTTLMLPKVQRESKGSGNISFDILRVFAMGTRCTNPLRDIAAMTIALLHHCRSCLLQPSC